MEAQRRARGARGVINRGGVCYVGLGSSGVQRRAMVG
jgi:hypothetical protein